MKGRSSLPINTKRGKNEGRNLSDRQNQYTGVSFSNLPNNILENIFIRLSTKRILVCKCVCKKWYSVVSDPKFAKLHFGEARVCPLLRHSEVTFRSRMLSLVEAEIDDFESKLDMCSHNSHSKLYCFCETKLKIPLPSLQPIVKDRLKMEDVNYRVVNSCNGLLCLADPTDNDPVIIWNPITGEFINLPPSKTVKKCKIVCGFGFSPTTNQYKVIRMLDKGLKYNKVLVAEVNTLGTESWKYMSYYPDSSYMLFATYFNGRIYWLSLYYVIFFDFEKECFGSVSVPPLQSINRYGRVSMGVLRGELCISEAFVNDIKIWSLKDNGVKRDWCVVFHIDMYNDVKTWPLGSYQLIKYLNNGELLMFHPQTSCLVCYDPRKPGYKTLNFRVGESKLEQRLEAIPHIPSFISLKHILAGQNVKVFNVKSREYEIDSEDGELIESDSEDGKLEIYSEDSVPIESDSEDRELLESDSE